MARESLLIIDDLDGDVARIRDHLGDEHHVRHARTLREGRRLLDELAPDVVLVSLELAEAPGPRVVRTLKEWWASVPVIALTSSPSHQAAVATVRAGGADYLEKPLDPERLDQALGRALRELRAERMLRETQEQVADRYGFKDLLSRSPKMLRVFDQIEAVAPTDATVLILGETGTGKELVARAIHDGSRRRDAPYVSVNCGAFAEGMLESELFGHERGSFTGAVGRRDGVFSLADKGTLFLDELGETSLAVQVNLLRVLEEMAFRRVGGETLVRVEVRVIAATNTDLEEAVASGRFRDDLYWRLNVFPIRLPPLRERPEDIPLLLRHFLDGAAREYGLTAPTIAADAMAWIRAYAWPGNVRQLRAMAERWVIEAKGRTLLKEMLPRSLTGALGRVPEPTVGLTLDPAGPLAPQLDEIGKNLERAYLARVLEQHEGHLSKAAAHAGISRRTLYTKCREYGLEADRYRR